MRSKVYLIAESGQPREVLEAWREDWFRAERGLAELGETLGFDGCFRFSPFEKPVSFRFPNNIAPEGWLKPSRNGATRPKRGNVAHISLIEDLPWCRGLGQVVREAFGFPMSLEQNTPRGRVSSGLFSNGPVDFYMCWTAEIDGSPGVPILITPDYEGLVDPEATEIIWHPEGSTIRIPEGFRRVSKAEMDLIFVQSAVNREAAQLSPEAIPT